jgi:hypothetical protein
MLGCTGPNTLPTPTRVGLSLAKIALKMPHAGRNRSLVARTNKCGECISYLHLKRKKRVELEGYATCPNPSM